MTEWVFHVTCFAKVSLLLFVIFILQETRNSNLFDKNYVQENVKCHIQLEES